MRRVIRFHRFYRFLGFLGFLLIAAVYARAEGHTQKTVRDNVYSKAQAERGAAQFAKVCAGCHDPAKLDPAKEKGPELVGERFLDEWQSKPLSGVLETVLLTMPNDGSAVLTEEQTADVVAYILQANGFPDGPADLTYAAGTGITIVK